MRPDCPLQPRPVLRRQHRRSKVSCVANTHRKKHARARAAARHGWSRAGGRARLMRHGRGQVWRRRCNADDGHGRARRG
eukprot:1907761-Prymnesium_polylepis.1